MKNALNLLWFILLLSPFLLSAQRSRERDATTTITDSALAFCVKVPFKIVVPVPSSFGDQVVAKMYAGNDSTENTRYIFGFATFKPGSYLMDDSSYYSGVRTELESAYKELYRDTVYMMKGCFVEDLYGIAKAGNKSMYRYITRGNGWYMLIANFYSQRPAPTARVQAFFDSFSMLDYPDQSWHPAMAPDSSLTTWAPSPFVIYQENSSNNLPGQARYLAFDSLHFNSYFISHQQVPPYFWSRSDSALYTGLIATRTLPTDSLIYEKPVSNGDAKGWECVRKPRNGLNYERERVFLNGDQVYFLTTHVSASEAASPNTNRFFEDFRFTRPVGKTKVFDSKAVALLKDLFGSDPARAVAALTSMRKAPFDKGDLPMLYACMLKMPAYQGNHHNYYVKAVLTSQIIHIHDTASYRWAGEHYKTLSVPNDYEKGFLLDIMASFPSPAHYSEMAALMHASPPSHLPIDFMLTLGNHLRESAPLLSQLLALPGDSSFQFFVVDLAGKLADSNLLPAAQLFPFRHQLLAFAATRITYLSTDYGSPRTTDDALISLLGLLNSDSSNAALREYLETEFHDERVNAFAALLRNGKQTNEDIRELAEDKSTRLDIYRILEKAGRLPLFPVAFRTQKMFSESAVYAAAMEFELEPPSAIDFLDSKVTGTGAASKSYFIYKVKSKNGSTHLACAGPYSPDPKQTGNPDAAAVYDHLHVYDPAYEEVETNSMMARLAAR